MNDAQPKSRGGRPQKFPGEGPRVTQATRLRPAIAAQLAEEAEQNHRSIGEEIEYRINKSFGAIVIDADVKTMDTIKSDAIDANCSLEEYTKRVFETYKQMQKLTEIVMESYPALKLLSESFYSIKTAAFGLILAEVFNSNGNEIYSILRKSVIPETGSDDDPADYARSTTIISEKLRSAEDFFKQQFEIDSMNDIYVAVENTLATYIEKKSGYKVEREDFLKRLPQSFR